MAVEDKLIVIRKNDFLAKLDLDEYESLNVVHNFIMANKSAYIYFDPQSLTRLFFIKEGYVKIGNIDNDGNEIIRDILSPGDVFGQFALEQDNMDGEFAQAYKKDVAICAFSIGDFKSLLMKRPDLSIEYARKVGRQMRRIDNRLMNLLQKDVRSRLLYFFWTLVQNKIVANDNDALTLENYLTHEDIARLTGTSRQTVTTLITQLSGEGIIEFDKKKIVVRNIKLLQKEINVG